MQKARNGFELFFRFHGIDPEDVRRNLEESDETISRSESEPHERSSRR